MAIFLLMHYAKKRGLWYNVGMEQHINDTALLAHHGLYTSFAYGDTVVRFLTSQRLDRYIKVLKWDNGYIETIASYNGHEEEEYIDLVPILKNLFIEPETFLKPIRKVEVSYAGNEN